MREGALVSALTIKSANQAFLVLEGMETASGKTRDAAALLGNVGAADEKVVVVIPNEASEARERFVRGLQNLPHVKVLTTAGVNVYDLMDSRKVLCVREALPELEARVSKAAE
jgi:large subunit ribosomal protein L4